VRTEFDINRSLRGSWGASNDANFGGLVVLCINHCKAWRWNFFSPPPTTN
jgi:hypothetical protein